MPSLAVAASTSCNGVYTVTQSDFDAGQINNTATVNGVAPQGAAVSDTGSLSTPMAPASPALTLDKVAAAATYANVGDNLAYTFTVTNSGNVTLNNVVVTDPLVPTFNCTIATLAPGAVNSSCATTYQVAQADINAGQVNNTASVGANAVRGLNPTATDTATVGGPLRSPSASIVKSATPATYAAVGGVVSYSYQVTNTGNTSLTGAVTISDDKLSTVNCPALPIAGLAPGGSLTCTASHTITQADLDAGSLTNTASASANSSTGAITSPADSATVTAVPAPALRVVKNAGAIADNDGNGPDAGDTIAYSFTVNNPGNVTLSSLTITDPLLAGATPPVSVVCPVTTLSPGASTTCGATYILTQAKIDAGSVTNTATATASPPSGPAVSDLSGTTAGNDTPTVSSIPSAPAIAVIKTAGTVNDLDGNGADPGDTIAYTFTVSNQGNVTLASVRVADAKISGINCPVSSLAPGATTVCNGTYTLDQNDVNAGQVTNTATASGTSPKGAVVTDQSGNSITDNTPTVSPINQLPVVAVVKSAGLITDMDGNGADAGDRIVYTFLVSNEGNVSLTSLAVADAKTGPVICPATVLAPGANMSCSATYILKQTDIDAGGVTNTATASGRAPGGITVTDVSGATTGDNVPTIATIPQNPALSLAKTSSTASFDAVGDVLTYAYVVRNTGTVTITNAVSITDDKTTVNCPALPGGALAPGGTITCSANYVVAQADIDAGSVINTAFAATTFGPGNALVASPDDQATVPAVQSPAMVVAKSATTVNFINVGDIVSYQYVITNTGNTTLNGPFTISDNRVPSVNCPIGIMAPAGTMTCTGSYALVVEDLDIGSVTNLASASNGATNSPLTSVTIPPGAPTALTIAKASTTADFNAVGDTVDYGFTVTNSGGATFTRPITVTDDKIGLITCWTPTAGDPTFTPSETVNCAATYTIGQADLDRGFVSNGAYASTTYGAANIPVVSAPTALTVNAVQTPLLDVAKSAAGLPVTAVGQVLTYTITATNSGNVTLTNAQISDPRIPTLSCLEPSLAVTAIASCSGTYVVSQADFDAGVINNAATASSVTPQGNPVTGNGTNSVVITQSPEVILVKTAGAIIDLDGNGADAGDQITYDFLIRNAGNVTLTAISITDAKIGQVTCSANPLAPGLSTLCQATYTLLQSDVNAGSVSNTALVSAQPPSGAPVTDVSGSAAGNDTPTVSSIPATPRITLVKSASPIADVDGNGVDAGDTIAYAFTVTNTGNQTLNGVNVTDPLFTPATVACVASTLAPGADTTCGATYVLQQSDLDAGSVTNSATASGLSPSSISVADSSGTLGTNDDPTFSNIPRVSSLALAKLAGTITDPDGNGVDAGDTVNYTFQIGNTGNQTLTNVTVTDAYATVIGGPIAALPPGATDTTSFTATHELTQADVDAGNVQNTALVIGNPPTGPPATDTSGTDFGNDTPTDKTLPANPSMTLLKTSDGITDNDGNGPDEGDTVNYTFTARNTGNVTLTNVAINDPLVGLAALEGGNEAATLLAMAATGYDPLTTASTSKLVEPVAQPEKKSLPTQVSEALFGAGPGTPEIATALSVKRTLVRLQADAQPLAAGDKIGIYFTLVNTGEGPLTAISADQTGAELLGSGIEILPANAAYILPAVYSYTLTDADIAAGRINAPATLRFWSRSIAITQLVESPLALADIEHPADLLTGSITPALVATMAPGQTVTFNGTYQLTQADVDAGGVDNTATIAGRAPDGSSTSDTSGTTDTNDTPTTTTIARTPAIAMVKSASAINDADGNGPDLGDTIQYSFDVRNLGNVTLTGIAITDVKVGTISCPQTTIAPASSVICTATYTLTQADVDSGNVTNTARVTGTAPGNTPVEDTSGGAITDDIPTVSVVPRKGGLTLVKTAETPTTALGLDAAMTDVDDTIAYEFVLQNIGNVTLTPISIADAKIPSITCPVNVLAPTESTTCTGTYTLVQADFDLGTLENTATGSGTTPDGKTSSDVSGTGVTNDTPTQTTLPQTARMTVVKSAGIPTSSGGANAVLVDVGDTIEYSFLVANTGNVTLNDIAIADDKVPDVKCPVATLIPGANTICTGTFTLTQIDLDAGRVDNTATGTGAGPGGITTNDPSGTDATNDTATQTLVPQVAMIALVKTASPLVDVDGNGPDVGDTIQYNFAVTNQGNVTLNPVAVTDDKVAAIACPSTTLAPAITITCTGTYTLLQADLDAGQVENQALATGTPPNGTPVTDLSDPQTPGQGPGENDKTITSLTQQPAMTVLKLADVSGLASPPLPGNKIIYSFAIRNAGNVTLTDITLVDTLANIVLQGGPIAKLLPDNTDSTTFKAVYTITAADISAGFVENSATATGNFKNPQGVPQTTSDTSGTDAGNDTPTRVPLTAVPRISVVKKAKFNDLVAPTGANLGDTITYTFIVANLGNVQLTDIKLSDRMLPGIGCDKTTLDVGENTTCSANVYELTQADINAGEVRNQAIVSSTAIVEGEPTTTNDESGTSGSNDDPTITGLPFVQPTFTKTASKSVVKLGETITFTIKATSVVFTPADIIDQLPGGLSYVPNSAIVNGVEVVPLVSGRRLTFNNITPIANNITITLRAVVNASATDGPLTNRAKLIHPNGTVVAEAKATVEVRPDPVFDCGDIIGKVFDDANSNGIQDAATSPYIPERGLPGVRVVTVNGTLITTDKNGKFHIACADIPNAKTGSNFILKLDPRSLPSGYRLTTENPRVVRLTRGKLSKINFGASISRVIKLDLTDKVFVSGGIAVSPKLKAAILQLVEVLDAEPSVVRLQYHLGSEGKAIATRRLKLIAEFIAASWDEKGGRYKLPVEQRLLLGKQQGALQ